MKNFTKQIIVSSLIGLPILSNAQFNPIPPMSAGRTNAPVQKIGIGNFPTNASVQAKLHVSQFRLAADVSTTGLLFRTDGGNAQDNIWSIYTGPSNLTLTEKLRLYVPANSTNVVLQAQQGNSRMMFNTNGAINRLLIMDGGTAATGGRVAIGNNLAVGFIPQARLQLLQFGAGAPVANMFRTDGNSTLTNRWLLFTGDSAGATTEKFRLEVPANSTDVELNAVQSSARMWLNTRNVNRILIDSGDITGGRVAIGNNLPLNFVPQARLHVYQNFAGAPAVMFLTNGSSAVENSWKLTTSPTPGVLNEIFKLYTNPLGGFGNDIFLQAGRPNGRMIFNTTGTDTSTTRMVITDGVLAGNTGFIGMGNNFLTPRSQLHLNDGIFPTYLQITNTATNINPLLPAANDGFKLGIDSNGTAHVKQQENLPLIFYTNNTENARVLPAAATTMGTNVGMVGIGNWTTAPNITNPINAKLDIDGDLRIRTVTQRDTLLQVLVIDSADKNRVHWRSISSLGNGINCWDTNGNSIDDPSEDTDSNGVWNALDCQGVIGLTGPAGPIGLTGATGATGLTGATGPAGTNGTNGTNGIDGINGTNGIDGIDGVNGATGPQGPQGTAGLNGINCWDTNGNGINDLSEDTNGDMAFNTLDCQGTGGGGTVTADNGLSINPANNVQLGNDVGLTTAQLINDREIPMNNFNTYFTGQGFSTPFTDNIYLGYPTTTLTPVASKFSVIENVGNVNLTTYAGHFRNIDIATTIDGDVVGIAGIADAPQVVNGINNIGGYFNAENAPFFNTGVVARSSGSGSRNTGVDSDASGGNYNYGVQARASGNAFYNYGVLASANGATTNYAIYASSPTSGNTPPSGPNYAGFFVGDLAYTGTFGLVSDLLLKQNINNITNALSIINQLNPKSFEFKVNDFPQMNLSRGSQMGLIAQDVELVVPEIVKNNNFPAQYDSLGNETSAVVEYKSIDYVKIIPLLIAGMKEQQVNIDSLEALISTQQAINSDLETRLAYLENCIRNANLCTEGNRTINTEPTNNKTIELINTNSIILDQNLPNPFAEHTVINYNIPAEVMEAKLLFYDLNGRIIKELIIDERGESKLTIYGVNLKTGVYTYSLIADGKLIATKKMVKK